MHIRSWPRRFSAFFIPFILLILATFPAVAALVSDYPEVRTWFPEADRYGEPIGAPPAAEVRDHHDALVGYLYFSDEVVRIPAYSGHPLRLLVGFDQSGRIRGVRLVAHHEPILAAGVSEERLAAFVGQYPGHAVTDRVQLSAEPRAGWLNLDAISGATITASVLNTSVMRSVAQVAQSRGVLVSTAVSVATTHGEEPSPWKAVWKARRAEIVLLGVGISCLILIMLFMDSLTRRPRLYNWVRHGFLLYTLFFVGWFAQGQLSVIHVLTFLQAVTHDFHWDTFLLDPILFILWCFVAVVLLLWGRGVYCGWLCPFGALQTLLQHLGQYLRLPQWSLPAAIHERLWALKYVLFLGLLGLSLDPATGVERYLEIEPFKTVFVLHFLRPWGYTLYAAILVVIAFFYAKLYCNYLCPLGAALAIPTRLRLFDWLRRRRDCGRPCQLCARECRMQAIKPTGEIIANECLYCLDCQVTYWSTEHCPPLVERQAKRARGGKKQVLTDIKVNVAK
ncbi:NosR/NirI family transcriptional regulator, nitrous oxide reductase regulator [Gammaproteobacteria bacterium]